MAPGAHRSRPASRSEHGEKSMAEAASAPRTDQFSIGNVLGTSFAVIARNLVPFLLIAVAISIPYFVISRLVGVDPQLYQNEINQKHVYYYASLYSPGTWFEALVHFVTVSLV